MSYLRDSRRRAIGCAAVFLLLVAAAAPADSGREEFARTFQKTMPLKAGQRFSIESRNGDIRIRTHAEPQVSIDAKIRVSSSDREGAEKFSNEIKIEVEARGDGVSVRTVFPEKNWHFEGRGYISYSVDYEITMPESALLTARNRFGDVEVTGLKAAGDVFNGNGKVVFRDTRGKQRIENSFGAVEMTGNAGDATVINQNGTVTASNIEGDLEVRDRFGRVSVTKVSRRCQVTNGNGDVLLADVDGEANVTSSFGKIDVRNVGGALAVQNTNGSVTVTGVAGRAELATSFGSLTFSEIRKEVNAVGTNSTVSGRK
ncbi:MAG TPA: hypothetical protein VK780_02700, partial [Thermoanaerobaculia bacterium]|nr:hypothetical protein [Thermoanaerobaculia bacterium]